MPGNPAISDDGVAGAIVAIEQAVLVLGLQPKVTYDEENSRFSVVAVGSTPLNNAKLAERIIRIVGDPEQPGAIELTHSQLRVRIQPDPTQDRPCNCGFQ